ncbi:MAG: glycosyltransferase family 4 protein [Bacteroidetes bacterium]|nr:glycosyltransferase family 4 protein [Bacteroidota bacterium]
MKIVCITYTRKAQFNEPKAWLHRVRGYIGILEALSQKHEVVSIDRINYTGNIRLNGVDHVFPEAGASRLSAAWRLNRYAAAFHPDIVLIQGMIFPLQTILLRLQLGHKVRIILQNHAEKPGRRRRKLFQQLADPVVDAYLFAAKEMGNDLVNERIIRHPAKIHQVMEPSSVFQPQDQPSARAHLNLDPDTTTFLWVGRLDTNKDPLTVVKAFLQFIQTHPARLYMIFHTNELQPQIEKLLDENPAGKNHVFLIGEKPHDDMQDWYSASDYVISGSHYEGSGVAICEAMSCGCIPILTDILSFRMMTDNGNCGILYPAGDSNALTSALKKIMERNKQEQRQKVLNRYNKELSFQAIADAIHEIASGL